MNPKCPPNPCRGRVREREKGSQPLYPRLGSRSQMSGLRRGSGQSRRARLLPTVASGLAVSAVGVGLFTWYWRGQSGHPDFDQLYYAALSIRGGTSPYADVAPTGRFHWPIPFYYPLP